jgi:hypothetical protein
MIRSFENYLIMVGIRSLEFDYPDDILFKYKDYYKNCYNDNLSAYKALLFLNDYIDDSECVVQKGEN